MNLQNFRGKKAKMKPDFSRFLLTLLVIIVVSSGGAKSQSVTSAFMTPMQQLARMTRVTVDSAVSTSRFYVFNQGSRSQCFMMPNSPFPCLSRKYRSDSRPHSVHKLRPGDIDVIVSMGDSLVTGLGALATNILGIGTEFRGVAFSSGGDKSWREYVTLPNILKLFNPYLYGYSKGKKTLKQDDISYNMAISGAESDDLAGQARKLVYKLKTDPNVNFVKDWKLVTILVGGNDVCSHACPRIDLIHEVKMVSPVIYARNIAAALDILHSTLPRTFVNLLAMPDVTTVLDIDNKPLPCIVSHVYGCPCLFDLKFSRRFSRMRMHRILNQYYWALEKLVESGRYDTHDDFTVVLQPMLVSSKVPPRVKKGRMVPDLSYFAPDCIHWGQKIHALAARSLWNNMVEPYGQKSVSFRKDVPFLCPTEDHPYFSTKKNSQSRKAKDMTTLASDFVSMMMSFSMNQIQKCNF